MTNRGNWVVLADFDPYVVLREELDRSGVDYEVIEHEATTTSVESARARGVPLSTGAKALIVSRGRSVSTTTPQSAVAQEGEFVLRWVAPEDLPLVMVVIAADQQLDWKLLKPVLGSKKARLASDGELRMVTSLGKGAIPPFGHLFGLRTYFDASITRTDRVYFNAGSLTVSIGMNSEDLIRLEGGEIIHVAKPARHR